MSMMLGMLEGMLGLTDDEKAKVAPCLPALKTILDTVNAHIDDLWALNEHFCKEQVTVKRLVDDYRKIGPNASQLLGDGWVDIGGTMGAAKDMQTAVEACPAVKDIGAIYNRLVPAINIIMTNSPKAAPAINVIVAAMQRKKMGFAEVMQQLPGHLR